MANLPWLDEVLNRLAKRGLPPSYIARLAEELSDHIEDFKEENMSTEADAYSRLGKPEQVADAAVAAYRRRSFLGRHPMAAFLVFGLSPIVSVFLAAFITSCTLTILFEIGSLDEKDFGAAFPFLIGLVLIALVTFLYCELGRWLGIGAKWMFISCMVLAAAMLLEGCIEMGCTSGMAWGQFVVPLTVGWWSARRKHEQSYPATVFFLFAVLPLWALGVIFLIEVAGYALLYATCGRVSFPSLGITIDWCGQFETHTVLGGLLFFFLCLAMMVSPCGLVSALYCKLAKRCHVNRKWALVPFVVLATVAILPGYYHRCMCAPDQLYLGRIEQLGEFLVPLAVGWWFVRRTRNSSRLQLAS